MPRGSAGVSIGLTARSPRFQNQWRRWWVGVKARAGRRAGVRICGVAWGYGVRQYDAARQSILHCSMQPCHHCSGLQQLVLPNAKYTPATFAQFAAHAPVAVLVALIFCRSKLSVRRGRPVTTLTAMPKTSIDKHCQPVHAKNKIRLAKDRRVPPPACDAVRSKQARKHNFGVFVSLAAYARHHLRALGLGEYV